jgi:hypothetical protein
VTLKLNTAEGGTHGTGVTTGNSGGGSGDAFSTVSAGAGGVLEFSNVQVMRGSLAYAYSPASATQCYVVWNDGSTGSVWGLRFYLRLTGNPSAETVLVAVQSTGGAAVAQINLMTTGALKSVSGGNTTLGTTSVLSLNTWYRVTLSGIQSATAGVSNLALYLGDDGQPVQRIYNANVNNGATAAGRGIYGRFTASGTLATFYVDDMAQNLQSGQEPMPTLENLTSLSISHVANGTTDAPATATATTPGLPAGTTTGDVVYAHVVSKGATAITTSTTGWALVATVPFATGTTAGNGTGPGLTSVWRAVQDGSLSAPAFTVTGGNSTVSWTSAYRASGYAGGLTWMPENPTFYDRLTTAATAFGGTVAMDPGLASADIVAGVIAASDDAWTVSGTPTITATSATIGTLTSTVHTSSTGFDVGAAYLRGAVTAGASTAAPAVALTSSTSETGGGLLYRVRAYGLLTAPVTGTRATTWIALAGVTPATRDTTWNVDAPGGTTPVTATRDTTWHTLSAAAATRASTWHALATVTATRATTHHALASVTGTRATTWHAMAATTGTRATSWATAAATTGTRATSWHAAATTTATRATTWAALASVTGTRATTHAVLSSVTPATRASTWHALAAVTGTRATSHAVAALVTGTRATTWNVAGTLSPVTGTRATTWHALASAAATRATSWVTLASATSTRSTTWVASAAVTGTRGTTWTTAATITATRATSYAVLVIYGTSSRATTWHTRALATTTRATQWAVLSTASGPVLLGHLHNGLFASSVTATRTTSAGSTLIALIQHQSQDLTSVTDSAGGTWTQAATTGIAGQGTVSVWFRLNAGATTSVTATAAATTALHMDVSEWANIVAFRDGNTQVGATTDPAPLTLAGTGTNDLLVDVVGYHSSAGPRFNADATSVPLAGDNETTTFNVMQYKVLTAGGVQGLDHPAATGTLGNYGQAMAVFSSTISVTPVTATRDALWAVADSAVPVTSSRATTWHTRATVANTRATLWAVGGTPAIPAWIDGAETRVTGALGAGVSITRPAGVPVGSYGIVAAWAGAGSNPPTTPAGWDTLVPATQYSGGRLAVYGRLYQSGDSATITVAYPTAPASGNSAWVAGGWWGADALGTTGTVTGGTITNVSAAAGVTTTGTNRVVAVLAFIRSSSTTSVTSAVVAPDATTRLSNLPPSPSRSGGLIADMPAPSPGTTQQQTITWDLSTASQAALQISMYSSASVTTTVTGTRATTWTTLHQIEGVGGDDGFYPGDFPGSYPGAGSGSSGIVERATTWDVAANTITSVTATRATLWVNRAQVTRTRATTWTAEATVAATRATTWHATASVTSTRATTWAVAATITTSRATLWEVRTPVAPATRATTWLTATGPARTAATTWVVRSVIAPATRASTWDTLQVLIGPLAWVPRSTGWNVDAIGQVTASRSTTWHTHAQPTTQRVTQWAISAAVAPATRSTLWTTTTTVPAAVRPTTWHVDTDLTPVTSSRATSWTAREAITEPRPTLWHVLVPVASPATRATTWEALARLAAASTRATSWGVAGPVTGTRSTTFTVKASLTAVAPTTWTVGVAVTPAVRASQWAVLATLASPSTRATLWAVQFRLTTTRASVWNVEAILVTVKVYSVTGPTLGLGRASGPTKSEPSATMVERTLYATGPFTDD